MGGVTRFRNVTFRHFGSARWARLFAWVCVSWRAPRRTSPINLGSRA